MSVFIENSDLRILGEEKIQVCHFQYQTLTQEILVNVNILVVCGASSL